MVVAGNSPRYCHNQTTDPNPSRIPNHKLSLLEMAENGGPFGMAGRHRFGSVLVGEVVADYPATGCRITNDFQ